jgi:hypothetical protein
LREIAGCAHRGPPSQRAHDTEQVDEVADPVAEQIRKTVSRFDPEIDELDHRWDVTDQALRKGMGPTDSAQARRCVRWSM